MKGILATGAAAVVVGLGAGVVLAQATPPPPPRPYYTGYLGVGLPVQPPAPTAANQATFVAMAGAVMYGALYSVESCSYDEARGLIVAPNRGVGQNVRVNDAWISLINHDGSVNTPRWIGIQNSGAQRDTAMEIPLVLNEPFGSDIMNGILYLADRDGGNPDPAANPAANFPTTNAIAMFDMATGAPAGRLVPRDATGATIAAFNDIEVAADGTIYGSVSGNMGKIWKVTADGTATILVDTGAPGLNSPNGVAFDPAGNLVVVNIGDNGVNTYDINTGALLLSEQAAQPGSDGLVIMADGTKYVSSVTMGGISRIRPGQAAELIATNVPSAASMCYDSGANQLVIPMNANNGLAFVKL